MTMLKKIPEMPWHPPTTSADTCTNYAHILFRWMNILSSSYQALFYCRSLCVLRLRLKTAGDWLSCSPYKAAHSPVSQTGFTAV